MNNPLCCTHAHAEHVTIWVPLPPATCGVGVLHTGIAARALLLVRQVHAIGHHHGRTPQTTRPQTPRMQAEAITEYPTAAEIQHGLCVDGVLYASSAAERGAQGGSSASAATTSGLMQPQLTSLPDILAMSRLYKVSKVCRQRSGHLRPLLCMLHLPLHTCDDLSGRT